MRNKTLFAALAALLFSLVCASPRAGDVVPLIEDETTQEQRPANAGDTHRIAGSVAIESDVTVEGRLTVTSDPGDIGAATLYAEPDVEVVVAAPNVTVNGETSFGLGPFVLNSTGAATGDVTIKAEGGGDLLFVDVSELTFRLLGTVVGTFFDAEAGYDVQGTNVVTSGRFVQNISGAALLGEVTLTKSEDGFVGLLIENANTGEDAVAGINLVGDASSASLGVRSSGAGFYAEALVLALNNVEKFTVEPASVEIKAPLTVTGAIHSTARISATAGSMGGRVPSLWAATAGNGGNIGTGEDALTSAVTLSANTLTAASDGFRGTIFGTFANNANAKRIRARFGGLSGDLLADTGANVYTNVPWRVDVLMVRGSSDQRWIVTIAIDGQATRTFNATTTRDMTASQNFALTAEATTTSDVSRQGYHFEFF